MLAFIGDTHGAYRAISALAERIPADVPIISVGDFGFWPHRKEKWLAQRPERMVYFIDGNHEYLPPLRECTEPTEVWPGLTYLPRGTVLSLNGHTLGACGGAISIDRCFRVEGESWWPEEIVTEADVAPLRGAQLDVLVTHTPPSRIIKLLHNGGPSPRLRLAYSLPDDWEDPGADVLDAIWMELGLPPLVYGHMQTSTRWQQVVGLNINEAYLWEPHPEGGVIS